MKKCKICGSVLPCINKNGTCKECDEQFQYCFNECKFPCRDKEEQKRMFEILKPNWNNG